MQPIRPRAKGGDAKEVLVGSESQRPLEAILKWVPVEVIAAYQFTIGVVPAGYPKTSVLIVALFVLLTGPWIAFATNEIDAKSKIAWRQVILATVAFCIWVVGTQPEIVRSSVPIWENWMGSIFLGVGWLLLPIADGILRMMGIPQD